MDKRILIGDNLDKYDNTKNNLMKAEHITGIAIGVSFGIIFFTFFVTLVVYWLLIKFNTSRVGMNRLILCLISVAVGAILGDTILNLIPEIFSNHYDADGVLRNKGDPIISSTIIISSYLAYFILEKIVKLLRNNKHQYAFESEEKNEDQNLNKSEKKAKMELEGCKINNNLIKSRKRE